MHRTTRRTWTRTAALSLSAGVAVLLTPMAASAAPTSPEQARQAVTETGKQLEAIGEQVNEATEAAAAQQAAADDAAAAVLTAQAQLDALEPQLRSIAQTGYVGTTRGKLAAFLTSGSADDLVEQMVTLDKLASHADTVVAQAATSRTAADQAQRDDAAASAAAGQAASDLKAQQDQLEEELA